MASVLAFNTSTLIIHFELDWRWIFRLPVMLRIVGAVPYYILVWGRPQDAGSPSIYEETDLYTFVQLSLNRFTGDSYQVSPDNVYSETKSDTPQTPGDS